MTDARHAYLDTAPLAPGDTVALVSPAGPIPEGQLEAGIAFYRGWGLEVVVGDAATDRHPRAGYLAGTDEARRQDLVRAWCDPDVDAVVATRGGYGCLRLLDGIDWGTLAREGRRRDGRPTLLTGSSDVTALHEAFRHHLDVPTLFCPMATNAVFSDSATIREDVHRWLFTPWRGQRLVGPRTEVLVPGRARGRFTGGNLTLLATAVGAPESVAPEGILFLEDVTEPTYRLDGYLTQLDRAGHLDRATGIVLGSWQDCGEAADTRALMVEFLADRGIPVLWEQGFGHDPDAVSVPLNVDGVLVADGTTDLRVGDEEDV